MKKGVCVSLLPLNCRMEGANLSHVREKVTKKSKLYHGLDLLRVAVTLSIRDKQGLPLRSPC
jgi:Ethanolamine utilization protein EutJ (predicted chaperonin)